MNGYSIAAKETKYKGVVFRSALEARWAIYFDLLGVSWVYEPDIFNIDKSKTYLPDFYIEEWRMLIEIKPNIKKALPTEWRNRCKKLESRIKRKILLCVGSPEEAQFYVFNHAEIRSNKKGIFTQSTNLKSLRINFGDENVLLHNPSKLSNFFIFQKLKTKVKLLKI